ncbi:hypothetical protein TNCV_4785781 [Trichonephila clavipes]|nr:hypothetical protein TNCV_4785781 [Trichonephila clavipes]
MLTGQRDKTVLLCDDRCPYPAKVVGSLGVRASDSRPEGLGSMSPNTLRIHTEYVFDKSVGPKVLWAVAAETTGAGDNRIFPSPPVPCLNYGGEDR